MGDDRLESDVARIAVAWRELRRGAAMGVLRRELHALDDGGVLELGQVDALSVLAAGGSLRMSDLADGLRVDASTATRAAQRLVEAGFAERRPDPDDRRGVILAVTPAGLALNERFAEAGHDLLVRLCQVFSDDERSQLADLMTRLVTAIDAQVVTTGGTT